MVVKGFQLPAAFVQLVNEGGINASNYDQPNPVDAYGNRWEAVLETYPSVSWIESENDHLESFAADPHDPPPGRPEDFPGFIPYIDDFSQIVCFGSGGEGEPYCFDYRENPDQPSIIYWDDVYWRRVAPEFETLLALYEPEGQALAGSGSVKPVLQESSEGERGTGADAVAAPPVSGTLEPQPWWSEETRRIIGALTSLGSRDFSQWLQSEHEAGRLPQGPGAFDQLMSELLPPEEGAE